MGERCTVVHFSLSCSRVSSQPFGTIQLKRALKIDISNIKPTDADGYKLYQPETIEKAYEIISDVYGKPKEEIESEVDSFLQKHAVDSTKPLYLTAYLVEAKDEEIEP